MTSAGATRLTSASTRCLSSSCSGMFSWMKSTCRAIASRSVVKDSLPLGGSGAKVRLAKRPFGVCHGPADPGLHFRLDVGGNHVDAEMQGARGPAAADDAGAQQTQRFDLSHELLTVA